MFYRIFRILARIALRLYFRRIEVEGVANVPAAGPLLLVCNHSNALVDPLFPLVVLGRRITLTAKNVLAKNPLFALLGKGLGVVYFHRAQDIAQGASVRENVRSTQRCREILAGTRSSRGTSGGGGGGAICIFPEGVSHSDLKMREFHSGSARIAMDFVRKDKNTGWLKVVPVGILYEHKSRFRSDVWLRFGEAYDVGEWLEAHPGASADELTADFRARIENLIVSYENRHEMLLVHWAGAMVATQGRMPRALGSSEPPVAESFRRLANLQAGYRELLQTHGPEIDALGERIRKYRAELKGHGVSNAEVYIPLSAPRALLFLIRELELIVVGLPIAAFGFLNHLVPWFFVRIWAYAHSNDQDQWASNVVYPSLVVFPIFYALQLAGAWHWLGWPWPLIYALALPFSGYYCLLYRDRALSAGRRARTFLHFLRHRGAQARLAAEGRAILAAIYALSVHMGTPPAIPPHLVNFPAMKETP